MFTQDANGQKTTTYEMPVIGVIQIFMMCFIAIKFMREVADLLITVSK